MRIVVMVAVAVFALWVVYINVGPFRFLPPPTSGFSSIPGPGEWAMSQRSPGRNAVAGGETIVPRGTTRWTFESGGAPLSSPVVVDGKVYLAVESGRIVALDSDTGQIHWEFLTGGEVKTTPAVAGSLLLVGLQDKRVVALDADSGGFLWDFTTGNPVLSSPVVYEGVLYIGSNDWRLYALDALTGEERWSFQADNVIRSDPAVHPPVVAFTDIEGKLYVLDLESGKRRFDYQSVRGAEGGAVFDEDRLFLADVGGRVRSVDWTQREFPFEKSLNWARYQLWHFGVIGSIGQQKGFVWFFIDRDSEFVGTPVVAHGNVYAAATSGKLVALYRESGDLKWEFRAPHPFETSPSIVGDILFAADRGGVLYAIDTLTGQETWRFETKAPVTSTPVIADRVLYLATEDGILYAVE